MRGRAALSLVLLALASPAIAVPDLGAQRVDATLLAGDWQSLIVSGSVTAEIVNTGPTDVTAPFDVLFFEDANRSGVFELGVDTTLGSTTVAALAATSTTMVAVTVPPTAVTFRDNLVFAFADSGNAAAESDETNNYADTGDGCRYLPPVGSFAPTLEWSWTSSTTLPGSLNVLSTPIVIDVSGDGVPDVLFVSTASTGGGITEPGALRALSGADGSEIFTVTDPSLTLNAAASLAAGDIDGDGRPEIIGCDVLGAALVAFEHDGVFKWRSPTLEGINWGGPSIADLDGDGRPEVVAGRQVLDAGGALLWTGTSGRGAQSVTGPLSAIADLDLDGQPEVMAGNTAYAASGAVEWVATVPDGFNAIGNFDADSEAEIVLVSGGNVWLLEHDGAIAWGPVAIPGGGAGGPPIVADYDDDGAVEIGVAGAVFYTVLETDGSIKWSAPTQDASSNSTGSSAFDFDGDGSAEVVYRDELYLRIYRGADGFVLFQYPLSSCTWHDYVLVADVDADDNAEIVAVANTNCAIGPQQGVFVFGDATNNWVRTRRIWNQHTYHITNVNDDGTIPARENDNWRWPALSPYNNFRQNLLTRELPAVPEPDATASRLTCPSAPGALLPTARIGNGGSRTLAAGLPISFYDGDPAAGGLLLGTTTTATPLAPGEFVEPAISLPASYRFVDRLHVAADDTGGLTGTTRECREGNNIHARALALADAGRDAWVCESASLTLDASGSRDADCPGGLLYAWRVGGTIVRPALPDPTFTPPTTTLGTVLYEVDVTCAAPSSCPVTDAVTVRVVDCTLAVAFDRVHARREARRTVIEWTTRSEADTVLFTVERARAADGLFARVGDIVASRGPGFAYRAELPDSAERWYRVVEHTSAGRGDASPAVEAVDERGGSTRTRRR